MKNQYIKYIETPLGVIEVCSTIGGIKGVSFVQGNENYKKPQANIQPQIIEYADKASTQIIEYFDGIRTKFDIPILLDGTPFQKRVWQALLTIPYGHTTSYKEIAKMAGSPRGFRATGKACGKNPISIIVPCHRVLASDGKMGGFSSGIHRKRWLLRHEARLRD